MTIRIVEETDEVVEKMLEWAEHNQEIQPLLKRAVNWRDRWAVLEGYVLKNLGRFEISGIEYGELWIRERFFYELQERTKQDYGFCRHFVPDYRERTKGALGEEIDSSTMAKCSYGGRTLETTCEGTSREICVHLHPEFRMLRGIEAPKGFGDS